MRAQALEALRQALRDAKRYGARAVLTIAGGVDEKTSYAENWDRTQAAIIESQPEIAFSAGGERLVSKETVVLVNLIRHRAKAAYRDGRPTDLTGAEADEI